MPLPLYWNYCQLIVLTTKSCLYAGVPKLNRAELETACEDFSNIVNNLDHCTIFKGTLSSGVEIAVVLTLITSSKEWSKSMERAYRKKVCLLKI